MNDAGREYIKGVRERAKQYSHVFILTLPSFHERIMRMGREVKAFELEPSEWRDFAQATLMEDDMNAQDMRRGLRKKFQDKG